MDWISNAQNFASVLGFLGYAGFGGMVLLGYFKKDNNRSQESDEIADTLIGRLKEMIEQQKKDLGEMTVRLDTQQKEIHQLQGQNEAYLKILALRDPATERVFKEAPEVFQMVRENRETLTHLAETMASFIEAINPILVHLGAEEQKVPLL